MEFIKKEDLQLVNGGYLSNKEGKPVSNDAFVSAQRRAHYLISLAVATKGKDYEGKKADSFLKTIDEVVTKINTATTVQYQKKAVEPVMECRDKMAQEALAWIKFQKDGNSTERINEAMQQFNVINDFEQFGLFFSEGIEKLEKIYTVKEILTAVKVVEPHLEKFN